MPPTLTPDCVIQSQQGDAPIPLADADEIGCESLFSTVDNVADHVELVAEVNEEMLKLVKETSHKMIERFQGLDF